MENTTVIRENVEAPKNKISPLEICFSAIMAVAAFVGIWGIVHVVSSYLG